MKQKHWIFLLAFALLVAAAFIQADPAQAVTNKTGGNNANLCMCAIRRPAPPPPPPPPKAPKAPAAPAPAKKESAMTNPRRVNRQRLHPQPPPPACRYITLPQ